MSEDLNIDQLISELEKINASIVDIDDILEKFNALKKQVEGLVVLLNEHKEALGKAGNCIEFLNKSILNKTE